MIGDVEIRIAYGTPLSLAFTLRDDADPFPPINVSGYAGELRISRYDGSPYGATVLAAPVTVGTTDGLFSVTVSGEQTTALAATFGDPIPRRYGRWSLWVTPPAGEAVPIAHGRLRLLPLGANVAPFSQDVFDHDFSVNVTALAPEGPPGPAGATGATGATGPQGPPGAFPVSIVATSNVALSGATPTIDGATWDPSQPPVLLTAQTTASQNGPWVPGATWARPTSFDTSELANGARGALFYANAGTLAKSAWRFDTVGSITLGSTALAFSRADKGAFSIEVARPPYNLVVRTDFTTNNPDQAAILNQALLDARTLQQATFKDVEVILPDSAVIRADSPVYIRGPNIHVRHPKSTTLWCRHSGGAAYCMQGDYPLTTGTALVAGEDHSIVLDTDDVWLDLTDAGLWVHEWETFQAEMIVGKFTSFANSGDGGPAHIIRFGGNRCSGHASTKVFGFSVGGLGNVHAYLRVGGVEYDLETADETVAADGTTVYHFSLNYDGSTIRFWVTPLGEASGDPDVMQSATGTVTQWIWESCVFGADRAHNIGRYQLNDNHLPCEVGSFFIRESAGRSSSFTAPSSTLTLNNINGILLRPLDENVLPSGGYKINYPSGAAGYAHAYTVAIAPNCNFSSITGGGSVRFAVDHAGTAVRMQNDIEGRIELGEMVSCRHGFVHLGLSYSAHASFQAIQASRAGMILNGHSITLGGRIYISGASANGTDGGVGLGPYGIVIQSSAVCARGQVLYQPNEMPDVALLCNTEYGSDLDALALSLENTPNVEGYAIVLIGAQSSIIGPVRLAGQFGSHRGTAPFVLLNRAAGYVTIDGVAFDNQFNSNPIDELIRVDGSAANVAPLYVGPGLIASARQIGCPVSNMPQKVLPLGVAGVYHSGAQSGNIAATNVFHATPAPGLYEVSGYVLVSTPATTGTLDVSLSYNDGTARSLTLVNDLDATAGGPGFAAITPTIIKVASGAPQISATFTSLTGTPSYTVELTAKQVKV